MGLVEYLNNKKQKWKKASFNDGTIKIYGKKRFIHMQHCHLLVPNFIY